MSANPKPPNTVTPSAHTRKYFTLEEANRALPYVRRIVQDIRTSFRRAVTIQQSMETPRPEDRPVDLADEYERVVDRLNGFVDELSETGAELKDIEMGLVDFPTWHENREVLLCWKPDEDQIIAWHECDGGYAGRRDINELQA